MAVVFLDTNIVIWGLLGQSNPGQKAMIPKTKYLFEELSKKQHDVHISSITLAEALCIIPIEKQNLVREAISNRLMVVPFDALAAKHYAILRKEMKDNGTLNFLIKDFGVLRKEFNADCMILGTALSRKATILYTHDNGLIKIASKHITIPDLPKTPDKMLQLPLLPAEQLRKARKTEASL